MEMMGQPAANHTYIRTSADIRLTKFFQTIGFKMWLRLHAWFKPIIISHFYSCLPEQKTDQEFRFKTKGIICLVQTSLL